MVSEPSHKFESLEPHCEGGIVRDFTIRSNTNGFGLRSNAIKDLCPLILHQLVIGWISKAHGLTKLKHVGFSHAIKFSFHQFATKIHRFLFYSFCFFHLFSLSDLSLAYKPIPTQCPFAIRVFFLLFNFYLIQQFLDPPRKSWLLCFSSLMILSICVDKWNTNKLKMFTMWHHLIFRYSRHTKNGNPFSHIYGGVLSLNSWWRGSTILLYFRST